MHLAAREDGKMREPPEQRLGEVHVAAAVLDASDGAGIALVEPTDDVGRYRHAADIGEVIEIEAQFGRAIASMTDA